MRLAHGPIGATRIGHTAPTVAGIWLPSGDMRTIGQLRQAAQSVDRAAESVPELVADVRTAVRHVEDAVSLLVVLAGVVGLAAVVALCWPGPPRG